MLSSVPYGVEVCHMFSPNIVLNAHIMREKGGSPGQRSCPNECLVQVPVGEGLPWGVREIGHLLLSGIHGRPTSHDIETSPKFRPSLYCSSLLT